MELTPALGEKNRHAPSSPHHGRVPLSLGARAGRALGLPVGTAYGLVTGQTWFPCAPENAQWLPPHYLSARSAVPMPTGSSALGVATRAVPRI